MDYVVTRLNPYPELMPVLPKVRPVKWWLWRLATIAVVVFFFAAAMVPWPVCEVFTRGLPTPAGGLHHFGRVCTPPVHQWALRIQIALTGVLVALLLIGLGSLLDHRRRRGASLV
jgi:hypothetical protein